MSISIKYKDVTLQFERLPSAADLQRAYEALKGPRLGGRPPQASYPLSLAQQSIWFQEQADPGKGTYNVPIGLLLEGTLDVRAFVGSVEAAFQRHDALRTRVSLTQGAPALVVEERVSLVCPVMDYSHLADDRRESVIAQRVEQLATAPIDLAIAPLARVELLKRGDSSHLFLAVFHHLLIDERSIEVLLADVFEAYRASREGRAPELPRLECSYTDFVLWQQERLSGGQLSAQGEYWGKRLAGEIPLLELFPDYPRANVARQDGGFRQRALSPELTQRIHRVAREQGYTPFMVALAATAAVLSRYTRQRDLVVGTPFAGRSVAALQSVVGLFVNVQPVRLELPGRITLAQLLEQVRERVLEAQANQDYPIQRLLQELSVEREPGRTPLFQTVLTYEPASRPESIPGLSVERLTFEPKTTKFEVSFSFVDGRDQASITAEFRKDLFAPETIDALLGHLARVLEQLCTDAGVAVDQVPLLSSEEREALIVGVNQADQPLPAVTGVHHLVEQRAAEQAGRIAALHGEHRLTYGELNRRANQLARALQARGVGPGRIVVLLFEQGVEVVTAMLAVMKAGGAYLPLDPNEPVDRLRRIVEDSGAIVTVTQASLAALGASMGIASLPLDKRWEEESQSLPGEDLAVSLSVDDLMNVLYTSGSTGTPKGVMLPHRGVLRLVHEPNFIRLHPRLVTVQLCPLNFDGATFEIWGTLANGGTLVVADKSVVLSPQALAELIRRHAVTTLILTTPLLNRLIEDVPEALAGLEAIVFGGEIISKPHMRKALTCCRPGALLHTYGPTENSFTSCFHRIDEVPENAWTIPIGLPVSNTDLYILDESLAPVPYGVVGEIYLSGHGLARGYLNDEEKTSRSFVPNPFARNEATRRMYRTGDRARRLRNGRIEFVSRSDDQIKVRSQRVEPGEVEAALRAHPGVSECFVTGLKAPGGSKLLAAYFVPKAQDGVQTECRLVALPAQVHEELRGSLKQRLPEYMVPTYLVPVTCLPLNPNGKVNRRELPSPEQVLEARPLAPLEGDTEQAIAAIWREVLGVAQVGVNDNFFEIGGHSLALVRVQKGLEAALGVSLPILEFFQFPTIRALAGALGAKLQPSATAAPKGRATATPDEGAIAIIGMAIRAPKADGLRSFWENIRRGQDCITDFTEDEVDAATLRTYRGADAPWVRSGGLLDDVFHFDPHFFGMTESEARRLDPQQRLFLECVWEAVEDAGVSPGAEGKRISLYAGGTPSTYGVSSGLTASGSDSLVDAVTSNMAFMATRISYKLNLKGESVMIDTLCSTSLVAVHMACASLRMRQADYALAGGVNVQLPQKTGYLYEANFILSPDGRCRAFDKDAAGTVPSNGAGAVLLRRLSDAVRDGDPIHAVIRGSAVNNDGSDKVGYYAPGLKGQVDVISRALQEARIEPSTISYIEAHGTGTKLGDPIEIGALTEVFRASTSRVGFCGIGSVKSNIGHLSAAAGVAGLVKTVLALKYRRLPPSIHYHSPNPHIDFARSPFYVVAEEQPWSAGPTPRRAGVSSYGIGGTNAHVILEEPS
jgi:amino acid adenylation domain-containing protein